MSRSYTSSSLYTSIGALLFTSVSEIQAACVVLNMEAVCFSTTLVCTSSPHGITTQNTNINIYTAKTTSDLIFTLYVFIVIFLFTRRLYCTKNAFWKSIHSLPP
jgi:hypothetical protein